MNMRTINSVARRLEAMADKFIGGPLCALIFGATLAAYICKIARYPL